MPTYILIIVHLLLVCRPALAAEPVSKETRQALMREGLFLRSVPTDDQPGATAIDLETPIVSRGLGSTASDANPQYQQGLLAYFSRDYPQAIALWRPLAEQGHAQAQANLGWIYQQGIGVPADQQAALLWLARAAEQGHVVAQNNLGASYENGWGIAQNYLIAAQWYRRAAAAEYGNAQYNLALLLMHGKGVKKDPAEAQLWFVKAVARGVAQARDYVQKIDSDKDN
ncbi:MAG: tetratricopeptide repeat protein [Pseudomonadota bacterium]